MMRTRTRNQRRWMWLAVAAVALLALFGGVAAAHDGYGVGDGTGPVGVEPEDGTGEQHHGPPAVEPVVMTDPTPIGEGCDGTCDQLRLRDQDRVQDQDQLRLRDQDRIQDQDQDRVQDQDRLHEHDCVHS